MPEMTERQAAAWTEAVAELQRFSSSIPDELGRWDVIWQDETRPGRGQALDARFNDGEHFAQITMDVYGFPRTSVAELEWIHASEDEECPCGHADEEPEPDGLGESHVFENEHGAWGACSCRVGVDHDVEGTPLVRNPPISETGDDRG